MLGGSTQFFTLSESPIDALNSNRSSNFLFQTLAKQKQPFNNCYRQEFGIKNVEAQKELCVDPAAVHPNTTRTG